MNEKDLRKQLTAELMRQRARQGAKADNENFSNLNATELYCPRCKQAMPVREKRLLVLPSGELFDYVCTKCGTSLGTRKTQ